MKSIKKKVLDQIAEWAIVYLGFHAPERLTLFVNDRARAIAQETAMRVSMEFMNRQGLLHCALCAQRHGLRYAELNMDGEIRRVLVCQTHYNAAARPPEKKLAEARS